MTDQECIEVYQELVAALRQMGLGWAIDQVNEVLRLGKIQQKKVRTLRSDATERQLSLRLGAEADLAESVPYTPQEQLTLLIDTIEQVAVNTAEMAHITISSLENIVSNQRIDGIRFISEDNDVTHLVSNQQTITRKVAADELREHLQVLRKRIHDNL